MNLKRRHSGYRTMNNTENHETSLANRETASNLNPFISQTFTEDTLKPASRNVSQGLRKSALPVQTAT